MDKTIDCTHGHMPMSSPRQGLRMQTLTTYEAEENGNMKVITITRTYYGIDDYIDSQSTQIIKGAHN